MFHLIVNCKTCSGFEYLNASNVLNSTQVAQLEEWTGVSNLSLCHNSSTGGFNSTIFRSNCNNKGASLVVIKTVTGYIFGGYTSISWSSRGGTNTADAGAFVYLLVAPFSGPLKSVTTSPTIYDHGTNIL